MPPALPTLGKTPRATRRRHLRKQSGSIPRAVSWPPPRDPGSTEATAKAAHDRDRNFPAAPAQRQDHICNGLGFGVWRCFPFPSHPHPASYRRRPSGCRVPSSPAVSAPIPRASFLPPHTDTPRAHLEPSDLHLQRNKINFTKCCLFFLLFAPRRA